MNKCYLPLLLAGLLSASAWSAPDAGSAAPAARQADQTRQAQQSRRTPITGLPYSATHTMTVNRALPDGERFTREVVTKLYRDSAGRTRRDMLGSDGEPVHSIITGADDLVLLLDHRNKVVSRGGVRRHEPVRRERGEERPALLEGSGDAANHFAVEPLGEREIEGMAATGHLVRHTIAIGGESVEVTSESWVSKELGIALYSRHSDPKGESTVAISELDRGEPDPALFGAPEDYRPQALKPGGN
jgi:hypothetical protein